MAMYLLLVEDKRFDAYEDGATLLRDALVNGVYVMDPTMVARFDAARVEESPSESVGA
jgi:alpha-D-ribose 1-methylphosphonate 5-phosphate C-P lyase